MLTSECDRCKAPTTIGDTYGAGFPNREGMWGRDYQTVISERNKDIPLSDGGFDKWMVQFGVFNSDPDLTLCAGCVLDIMAKVLEQAGRSHGHTHDDPGEHPDVHEVPAAPDVPAAGTPVVPNPALDVALDGPTYGHIHGLGGQWLPLNQDGTCLLCSPRRGAGGI